jgi:hypothetical protein
MILKYTPRIQKLQVKKAASQSEINFINTEEYIIGPQKHLLD